MQEAGHSRHCPQVCAAKRCNRNRAAHFAALLKQKAAGQPVENFDAALASAVRGIVKRQVEVGIDIVSDGEFGKGIGWEQYVIERLGAIVRRYSGFTPYRSRAPNTTSRLRSWSRNAHIPLNRFKQSTPHS